MRTLVLGLGNPILSDDGVGPRVAQEVQQILGDHPDVVVVTSSRGGLDLAEKMAGFERAVVVDAIQMGAPPGTIHRLDVWGIPTQLTASAHGINLRMALEVARRAGAYLPVDKAIDVVAVEAEDVLTFREGFGPAVESAVPFAVQAVLDILGFKTEESKMISPERLRRQRHCAGAPDALLAKVAMLADERRFRAGDVLFEEGQQASHLVFLESGQVDMVFALGAGQKVVVDTLVAGDIMCWSALLEPYTLTGSGVAKTDGVMIAVKAEGLRQLCMENPENAKMMMTEVAKTLRDRLDATRVQLAAAYPTAR
jgi:hydrogenase maturation protease